MLNTTNSELNCTCLAFFPGSKLQFQQTYLTAVGVLYAYSGTLANRHASTYASVHLDAYGHAHVKK